MPFSLTTWALEDFTGFSGGIATNTQPNNYIGDTVTLDAGAQQTALTIDDDDNLFEDAFIETGNDSTLLEAVTVPTADGGSINLPAGTRLENEFELNTNDVPPITFYIVRLGGAISNDGTNQLVFTSAPLVPGQSYTFASGADGAATPYDQIICFGQGAMIDAPTGAQAVETLKAGDLVLTSDGRAKPIRWIGDRHLTASELNANPSFRPIRISAGSLGDNTPSADLLVSPQHRVVVSGPDVELLIGDHLALAPAVSLVGLKGVEVATDVEEVTYWHFLLDEHEIVLANGLGSETLLPGAEALRAVNRTTAEEIRQILGEAPAMRSVPKSPAAPVLKMFEAKAIVSDRLNSLLSDDAR